MDDALYNFSLTQSSKSVPHLHNSHSNLDTPFFILGGRNNDNMKTWCTNPPQFVQKCWIRNILYRNLAPFTKKRRCRLFVKIVRCSVRLLARTTPLVFHHPTTRTEHDSFKYYYVNARMPSNTQILYNDSNPAKVQTCTWNSWGHRTSVARSNGHTHLTHCEDPQPKDPQSSTACLSLSALRFTH